MANEVDKRSVRHESESDRIKEHKRRLRKRLKPGRVPLDAETLKPARIDPDDVKAPPTPPAVTMRRLREIADSGVSVPPRPDSHSQALAAAREREIEAALIGPWDQDRVLRWMQQAMLTLFRLPLNSRPAGYRTAMPPYVTEFADLVARSENKSLKRIRNRLTYRHGPVTTKDHRRMEDAAGWQLRYLKTMPTHARVVGLAAFWLAVGAPIKKRARTVLDMSPARFYAIRNEGLAIIAAGLISDGKTAR